MTRVLELVLRFALPGVLAGPEVRSVKPRRVVRDFGAELVRAWRICPPVQMRRGQERLVLSTVPLPEGLAPGGTWHAWREEGLRGPQFWATRAHPLVPGLTLRETVPIAIRRATANMPAQPAADMPLATGEVPGDPPAGVSPATLPEPNQAAHTPEWVSERRRGVWHDPSGVDVALTLDDIEAPHADTTIRACELRLAVPDAADAVSRAAVLRVLFAAARELCGAWPAFPLPAGTMASLIEGRVPAGDCAPLRAEAVDLTGIETPREAFRVMGSNVVAQWFGNLGGVLNSEDTEYVHQLRVALRRLRTLTRLFPRYADAAWKETFGADLGWFGKLLGAVRDWDVFADTTLPALIAADGNPSAWTGTEAAARERGAAARVELRQAIGSARYARFAVSWLEWLSLFTMAPDDADGPSLARHAEKRVSRLFGRVYGAPRLTTLDLAACHQVRIDAKRLRYALEFFAPLADRRTLGETLKLLGRVQALLGDANDLEVGLHHLEKLAAPPYQIGFARGYSIAVQRHAVQDAEKFLADLAAPKFSGKR